MLKLSSEVRLITVVTCLDGTFYSDETVLLLDIEGFFVIPHNKGNPCHDHQVCGSLSTACHEEILHVMRLATDRRHEFRSAWILSH